MSVEELHAFSTPSTTTCSSNGSSVWDAPWHVHIARIIFIPSFLYILFLVLLIYPPFQRLMVFLHKVKWPLFPKYDIPEAYGFAPNKVRNLYIQTPDGVRIGLWHVLPDTCSSRFSSNEPLSIDAFDDCLRLENHKVMLFMHGNAATRLQSQRLHLARHVSSATLDMHFIIFDYRGFADSSNFTPSEAGLVIDARAVWDWLTEDKGVNPDRIVLAGQSLGTGIACALAARNLAVEGISPRALVLIAPFTSILDVLLTYKLLEVVPVLQPLRYLPFVKNFLFGFLQTRLETLNVIHQISCPILLMHSLDDGTIPPSHSQALFRQLSAMSRDQSQVDIAIQMYGEYAVLRHFTRKLNITSTAEVFHLEMHYGGHNEIAYSDLALHCMKRLCE